MVGFSVLGPDGLDCFGIDEWEQSEEIAGVLSGRGHGRGKIHAKAGGADCQVFKGNDAESRSGHIGCGGSAHRGSEGAKEVDSDVGFGIDGLKECLCRGIVRVDVAEQ